MIVDAHVHLGAWRHPGFLGLETGIEEISRELRAAGVGAVALTPSDTGDNRALFMETQALPLPCWLFAWARPGLIRGVDLEQERPRPRNRTE